MKAQNKNMCTEGFKLPSYKILLVNLRKKVCRIQQTLKTKSSTIPKRFTAFLILTVILISSVITAFPVSAAVDTTATSSPVYAGPCSSTYSKIGSVYNESVTVQWREGDYVYISYLVTGTSTYKFGYIPVVAVKNSNAANMNFGRQLRISNIAQTVYANPNWGECNSHNSAGSVFKNEELYILCTYRGMAFIEFRVTGTSLWKRGWVPDYTIIEKPTVPTSTIYGAEKAIEWAKQQLGSKSWNGLCLKFVADAYNPQGVSIGSYGNAKACANGKTKYNNYNAPRGALVFFDYIAPDGRNLGHIGISLGDGTFIHATSAGNQGVIISTLKGYADSRYLGWSYPSN